MTPKLEPQTQRMASSAALLTSIARIGYAHALRVCESGVRHEAAGVGTNSHGFCGLLFRQTENSGKQCCFRFHVCCTSSDEPTDFPGDVRPGMSADWL